jgi:hypothetical protein
VRGTIMEKDSLLEFDNKWDWRQGSNKGGGFAGFAEREFLYFNNIWG